MTDHAALRGGFQSAVFDAQSVFRLVMSALAGPGAIVRLPDVIAPPAPIQPASAAILATLADADTPVWLAPALRAAPGLAEWVAFHTGAPVVSQPGDAAFAVAAADAPLAPFAIGTDEYPDRSATVLIEIEALAGGAPRRVTGPGIAGVREIAPVGLPDGFWTALAANNRRFPRGIDVVLVAGSAMLALPRSTRIGAA